MRDFILLIDVGNTFLKWGLFRPSADGAARENRVESGHALLEEIMALPAQLAKLPDAGAHRDQQRRRARACAPTRSACSRCGPTRRRRTGSCRRTRNAASSTATATRQQLGSDRWAALIGARHLLGARPAMVVVCGTATTIDFLTGDGVFKGGVIMPGVGLMLRSLHEGTAALPDQGGDFFAYPTQTVDAIASGCQHAQAGAIERLFAHEQRVTARRRVHPLRRRRRRGRAAADDPVPAAREPGARGALPHRQTLDR